MAAEPLAVLLELSAYLTADRELEGALSRIAETALAIVRQAGHTRIRLRNSEGQLQASAEAGEPPTGSAHARIAVPLLSQGEVIGELSATSSSPTPFVRRDQDLLRLVASCASPLLARARRVRQNLTPQIVHAMCSPLRLRLMAELIEVDAAGLSLEEAVLRTGRHRQDVQACLAPFERLLIIERRDEHYRIRPGLSKDLRDTIEREVEAHAEQIGRERHVRHHLLGGMIGLDPKMLMVFELVRQVARIDVAVLIRGETGTGKELVARAIHDVSPRRNGFFGAVNCATLKESLFESQVFGHMRGAFTGAVQDYVGLVERCHEGTLFLDEVGDLSLENQVKLLRFLQEGTFSRLGESDERRSDFRLIAATNRDLEAMVQSGQFRDDLYYRLAVFPIRVPSLRERLGDLKYLVEGIMAVHAPRFHRGKTLPTITPDALRQLERYNWPGNVRELENVILRALVMAGGGAIRPEHLPEVELLSDAPPDSTIPPDIDDNGEHLPLWSLEEVQRRHIDRVLRRQRGNIKATAEILGISRTTLYKKIRDLSIDAPV